MSPLSPPPQCTGEGGQLRDNTEVILSKDVNTDTPVLKLGQFSMGTLNIYCILMLRSEMGGKYSSLVLEIQINKIHLCVSVSPSVEAERNLLEHEKVRETVRVSVCQGPCTSWI